MCVTYRPLLYPPRDSGDSDGLKSTRKTKTSDQVTKKWLRNGSDKSKIIGIVFREMNFYWGGKERVSYYKLCLEVCNWLEKDGKIYI